MARPVTSPPRKATDRVATQQGGQAISVLRVRSRRTTEQFWFRNLIGEAITATRYPGTTRGKFYNELRQRVAENALGMFVGFEDEAPKAIAVAMLPTSCMMLAPQVALVYSRGRPPLIRAMGTRLRAWIMAAGYDRVIGTNLYRNDDVFMRGFAHIGEPRRLGSLIEWRF
jgi:hypothetical protein